MRYILLALVLTGCGTPQHLSSLPVCGTATLDAFHFGEKKHGTPYIKECDVLEVTDSGRFRHMNPQTYRAP